jgi:hypothetical protein
MLASVNHFRPRQPDGRGYEGKTGTSGIGIYEKHFSPRHCFLWRGEYGVRWRLFGFWYVIYIPNIIL